MARKATDDDLARILAERRAGTPSYTPFMDAAREFDVRTAGPVTGEMRAAPETPWKDGRDALLASILGERAGKRLSEGLGWVDPFEMAVDTMAQQTQGYETGPLDYILPVLAMTPMGKAGRGMRHVLPDASVDEQIEAFEAALKESGIPFRRSYSQSSGSQYFDLDGLKVRFSDHDLPPGHVARMGRADIDIGPHGGGHPDGWLAAVRRLREAGLPVRGTDEVELAWAARQAQENAAKPAHVRDLPSVSAAILKDMGRTLDEVRADPDLWSVYKARLDELLPVPKR